MFKKVANFFPIWLIFITTFIFLTIAFLPFKLIDNHSINFIIYIKFILLQNIVIVSAISILIILALILSSAKEKKKSFFKNTLISLLKFISTSTLGFLLAYSFLIVVAILELNILSLFLVKSPQSLGIIFDTKSITNSLENYNKAPLIRIVKNSNKDVLIAIGSVSTGENTYFASNILSSIPDKLVLFKSKRIPNILLIDNVIIFSKIENDSFKKIAPVIAYLLIKEHFSNYNIKKYPIVEILSENEYQIFRKGDTSNKIRLLDENIVKAQLAQNKILNEIENDKLKISLNEEYIIKSSSLRNTQYDVCSKSKSSSSVSCIDIKNKWDSEIKKAEKNLNDWKKELIKDHTSLNEYTSYESAFKNKKEIISSQKEKFDLEQGLFTSPRTIKISIKTTGASEVSGVISTLIHEYLHYASFRSEDEKFDSTFFEEGLTEYFTRIIIQKNIQNHNSAGYPVFEKIISGFAKKIPENILADVYFSKSNTQLKNQIDLSFGKTFYDENFIILSTIHSTTDIDQQIFLANKILSKIKSSKISPDDLTNF